MTNPFANPEAPFGESHGPMLTGAFAPIFEEYVLDEFDVEGEIPSDLNGVYLRNGPNPRFEPNGNYHVFDGDGMLHAAHFDRGKVTYRNKWVRTAGWLEEDALGGTEYWGIMSTLKGRTDRRLKDTANTDVIGHAGHALATWYLAGEPYHVDPITLETLGRGDYIFAPGKGISAHPKVDEITGDLMFFDYFHEAPHMSYGVVDATGRLAHHTAIELPGSRLPHDMAVTENYSILHDLPVYNDEEAYRAGRHKIRFNAALPTRFGVIPRYGAADTIRWFEFSPCFLYHTINAWEEGDEVVMVACRYMPSKAPDGSIDEALTARRIATLGMNARLWRYRMNLKTGEAREECLDDARNVEFPGFDSARTGRKTRWGYVVDHDPDILRWTGIRRYDTDSGECAGAWSDGHESCWYSEPWFGPADNQRSEEHGYVVTFVWNDQTREQQLQVFDAQDIGQGPVARVRIPHRIPPGFHACWMKPRQIASTGPAC
jgi:carotenoid cleavage dioxygenase-like enzyme